MGLGTVAFLVLGNNVNYAEQIICCTKLVDAQVGDNLNAFNVNIEILPKDTKEKPVFYSSNEQIADVDFLTGSISCLAEGNAIITVAIKNSKDTNIFDTFELNITGQQFASNLYLQREEMVVDLSSICCTNKLTIVGDLGVVPVITYKTGGIVAYDYKTGAVTPLAQGNETVTVGVETSSGEYIFKSFDVIVVNEEETQTTTYSKTINVGEIKNFTFTNLAEGTNNANIIKITSGNQVVELLDYDSTYITIKGLQIGNATIEIVSQNSKIIFNITVE